ncbi:MAG: phosphoenolpyruvate--protein phosphotransferase [Acidobacteriota bacterium]|nr:phosphoenolpyruvate--protein phosphotransferase [Acidobacteriota bacterium]
MVRRRQRVLQGMGVSPGIAIGRAVCIATKALEVYRLPLPASDIVQEIQRFEEAIDQTRAHLETTRSRAGERLGEELAAIFDAHALMLSDESFRGRIIARIRSEKVNAEWAVHKTVEELDREFRALEAPSFQERREDLVDVSRYLLRSLSGIAHHELSEVEGDVVIVANDLTPSEAVRLGRENVLGFIIETGGRTSHTTIIARSLHLPMVAGVHGVTELVTDQDPVVVDGDGGKVILHPGQDILQRFAAKRLQLAEERRLRLAERDLPATTQDGVTVRLMANIDLPEEIDDAISFGAEGVGLYRSEFLYIERSPELPTEEEHLEIYTRMLRAMSPHPVVIRTFDLGGRRLARDVLHTEEENPVLGMRGIRLTLALPEIFKTQLRALLRAAPRGNLRVMLPLVSSVEEVRAFNVLMTDVANELEQEGLEFSREFDLGVMIEVPAAAMGARGLAREADFFSIGTNDLIQYAMAVDRNNDHVSHLYRPMHPAILLMIRLVVNAAAEAGIDVSVCGEMAGDPLAASVLAGLGLRSLSMSPDVIADVKQRIRRLHLADLEALMDECLEMTTEAEVKSRLATSLDGMTVPDRP